MVRTVCDTGCSFSNIISLRLAQSLGLCALAIVSRCALTSNCALTLTEVYLFSWGVYFHLKYSSHKQGGVTILECMLGFYDTRIVCYYAAVRLCTLLRMCSILNCCICHRCRSDTEGCAGTFIFVTFLYRK